MSDVVQGQDFIPVPPPAPAAPGLTSNVAAALAYVTIIPAILFLVLEPYNRIPLVRFHAFQSLGLCVCAFAVSMIMVVPILGWIIGLLLMPVLFVAWLFCIIKAYQGQMFSLPLVGPIIQNIAR